MAVDVLEAGRDDFEIGDLALHRCNPREHRQLLVLRAAEMERVADMDRARQPRHEVGGVAVPGGQMHRDGQGRRARRAPSVPSAARRHAGQDQQPVGTRLDFRKGVAGKQDRDAVCGETVEQFVEVAPGDRIEAAGRLVEDQKPGRADERLRQADALTHAFGICADPAAGGIGQADAGQQVHRAGRVHGAQPHVVGDLLQTRERRVEGGVFGQVCDLDARGGVPGPRASQRCLWKSEQPR